MSFGSMTVVVLLGLGASGYTRSRVDNAWSDPTAHCLWWQAGDVSFTQSTVGDVGSPGNAELDAVTRSFASWQGVLNSCGSLRLVEQPKTSRRAIGFKEGSSDNENLILFRRSLCESKAPRSDACWAAQNCQNKYDCWGYSNRTIALTTTTYDRTTGRVFDADIEFNAEQFVFTTVDGAPCPAGSQRYDCVSTDVQNTATHEIGHLLGLDHFRDDSSTMSASAKTGETVKRGIDPGSQAFICETYPRGRPSRDCVIDASSQELGNAAGCSSVATSLSGAAIALGLLVVSRLARRRSVPR